MRHALKVFPRQFQEGIVPCLPFDLTNNPLSDFYLDKLCVPFYSVKNKKK